MRAYREEPQQMQMCNDNETHLGYRGLRRRKVEGINDILEGGKKGKLKKLNIISACVYFNEDPTHLYIFVLLFLSLGVCEPSLCGIQRIILP